MEQSIGFYIASKYDQIQLCRDLATFLEECGHYVTARWLSGTHDYVTTQDVAGQFANEDLQDIANANCFILVNLPKIDQSNGRQIEYGYAMALKKHTIIIGERMSIFHQLSTEWFQTINEFKLKYGNKS